MVLICISCLNAIRKTTDPFISYLKEGQIDFKKTQIKNDAAIYVFKNLLNVDYSQTAYIPTVYHPGFFSDRISSFIKPVYD